MDSPIDRNLKLDVLLDVIESRRSIRNFTKEPVPEKDIRKLIEAATWAPSACNKQLWEFIYISDQSILNTIVKKAGAQSILTKAPSVIYVTYPSDVTATGLANVQSASAAIQNLSLCATALGLGTVWVEACGEPKIVRKILKIPIRHLII